MLNFCPKCGSKLCDDKFCANCGADLSKYGEGTTIPQNTNSDSAFENALRTLLDLEDEMSLEQTLRLKIIFGNYDEAKQICDYLIVIDPTNKIGYIGLVRLASQNYKVYEGEDITEYIRIAEDVFANTDVLSSDQEYTQYITARKQYFVEKAEAELKCEKFQKKYGLCVKYNGNDMYTVTGIEDTAITNLVIPDSVTSIEEGAFAHCTNLISVTISNSVTNIEKWAFAYCSNLTSITISDNLISIEKGVFIGCTSLKNITIPNGVNRIEEYAFNCCYSLSNVIIPDSVKRIGEVAFDYCKNLTSVTIPKDCQFKDDSFPEDCKVIRK